MPAQGESMWRFLLVVICFTSALCEVEVQLLSSYNGNKIIVYLNDQVTLTWKVTGDLKSVEFGTKRGDTNGLKTRLISIDENQVKTVNGTSYTSRLSGSWDGKSPGQVNVSITLSPIKESDETIFICKFKPQNVLNLEGSDTVQLTVRDPSKAKSVLMAQATTKGGNASLVCSATGIPPPDINWLKIVGSTTVEITGDNVKRRVIHNPGSSQLVIQNVTLDDQGYYICRASNGILDPDEARSFLGVVSSHVYKDSCPTSVNATIGESKTICCPVKRFPPPDITWQLPNGTSPESRDITLRVTLRTDNDFGRYRCLVRGLETDDAFEVTILKTEPDINDTKIVLKVDVMFVWQEVPGAHVYLLRLPETEFLKESSFLGNGASTSMEISYSSLTPRKDTNKSPLQVVIEVWAFGKSGIIGRGMRYTNVEIHASATTLTVSLMTLLLSFVNYSLQ